MTTVAEFLLPIDMAKFVQVLWRDKAWYESFLRDQLEDINISVGDWTNETDEDDGKRVRHIQSHHPSKISFPGLPAHAESHKVQTMEFRTHDEQLFIKEANSFQGIPYADYFTVNVEWCCMAVEANNDPIGGCLVEVSLIIPPANSTTNKTHPFSHSNPFKYPQIKVTIVFHKSTWLQYTIEANTVAELKDLYQLWYERAIETLETHGHQAGQDGDGEAQGEFVGTAVDGESESALDIEEGPQRNVLSHDTSMSPSQSPLTPSPTRRRAQHEEQQQQLLSQSTTDERMHNSALSRAMNGPRGGSGAFTDTTDDDEAYYDCEEPALPRSQSDRTLPRTDSLTPVFSFANLPTPMNDHRLGTSLSAHHLSPVPFPHRMDDGPPRPTTVHELAVSVVETLFVVLEFSYWKVYGFYQWDLKEGFRVTPGRFLARITSSIIPGRHATLINNPDMYGPLLGTLALPQVLLLSIAHEGGCSRPNILGNAVVTGMCLWLGLSSLYRVVAMVLAPAIHMKHTLCMTGYSFYPWMVALLTSHILEEYVLARESHELARVAPLLVIGLPSSLAMGALFWDLTPSSATIALRPTACSACPQRVKRVVTSSWPWLSRFLTPKILAFVFVTATHYQFLWYLARVFLPGRKQMCRLSAIIQPSAYADILTQKELLHYASLMMGRESNNHEQQ